MEPVTAICTGRTLNPPVPVTSQVPSAPSAVPRVPFLDNVHGCARGPLSRARHGNQRTTLTTMAAYSIADPVVVVGGSLAGMAAAARLAKSGRRVTLLEATDRLGGSWAPDNLDGVAVDGAPSVLGFPAPWRDLFRKSGRPLEAELARSGVALEPAAPARYVFADGSDLTLPTDRGQQHAVLTDAYGAAAAVRWRDLVDRLDRVWQAVRPLGLESELRDRRQLAPVRKVLRPRETVAQLARELAEPHLAAVVCSIAHRLGSLPELTPAWCAVELSVQRTFGRWQVTSTSPDDRLGRSSVLVETLAGRLRLRQVEIRLGQRVDRLTAAPDGRVSGAVTAGGDRVPASAVVCSVDPWQTYAGLWPTDLSRGDRRAMAGWRPARAPAISHRRSPGADEAAVSETVVLTEDGTPVISYRRPVPGGSVCTEHDYVHSSPSPAAGIAWDGFRSWLARPRVRTTVPGLFLAGPFSPGGSTPSSVVLSGALAAYASSDYLS